LAADAQGSPPALSIDECIQRARVGSGTALGQLLEACRPYLLLVANQEIEPDVKAKVAASDLVQETFLEALRDFERFNGSTEAELLAWLRRTLLNNVVDAVRRFRDTGKRRLSREIDLADAGFGKLDDVVDEDGETASALARAHETDEALEQALTKLPEQYREIIRMRNSERWSFEEIGTRIGRSAEAARKLWGRALEHLEQLLESRDASG
jgi:RNA polymerase sigma-70 factor (ECF subfamily)